ncbi:MAG: hypothetical protein HKN79_02895, partial [Flavobacteriales bacterium]|nr:hypothetical protein [Flavobacteriales bacterium]
MTISTNTIRTVLLILLSMSIGCTTSKSLMKDGFKYEEAGMYEDAVKAYKASLARKMTNVESRTGLRNAGQRVLDDMLDEFNRSSILGRMKEAVYSFQIAEDFKKEVKKYGVDLDIPDHYFMTYTQLENNYLDDLYEEGLAYLDEEDFDQARTRFDEIMGLDADYKDVHILQNTAILEPKYRRAQNFMDAGQYRDAYREYLSIIN